MSEQHDDSLHERKCLASRIEDFYRLLNNKQWEKCFEFVDPRLRDSCQVDLAAYSNSLSSFFLMYGPLAILSLERLHVYTNVPSKRDDRDFAYGLVTLEDRERQPLKVRERWVKASDGRWYTRMAGMV